MGLLSNYRSAVGGNGTGFNSAAMNGYNPAQMPTSLGGFRGLPQMSAPPAAKPAVPSRIAPVSVLDEWTGGAAGFIGEAMATPGRIAEMPFSLLNQGIKSLTGAIFGGTGFDAARAIGQTPVGDVFRGLGDAVETASNIPSALINSQDTALIYKYRNQDDDFVIPDFGENTEGGLLGAIPVFGGLFGRQKTLGELKHELRTRGFTDEDFDDLNNGRKGVFDYGDKMTNDNLLIGLGTRMIADPTNLLFAVPGVNVAKLAHAGGRLGSIARSVATTANRGDTAFDLAAKNGTRPNPVPSAENLAREMAHGRATGVLVGTRQYADDLVRNMERFGADLGQLTKLTGVAKAAGSTGKFLLDPRGYKTRTGFYKRAATLYGGSLAVTALPDGVADGLQSFAQESLDRRPMSDNVAFMLGAAFTVPFGDMVKMMPEYWNASMTRTFNNTIAPAAESTFGMPMKEIFNRVGRDTFDRMVMASAVNLMKKRGDDLSTPLKAAIQSMQERGDTSVSVSRNLYVLMEAQVRTGKLRADDIMNQIKEDFQNASSLRGQEIVLPDGKSIQLDDLTTQLPFNPELWLDRTAQYGKALKVIQEGTKGLPSNIRDQVTIGLRSTYTREQMDILIKTVDGLDQGGTIPIEDVRSFLTANQLVFRMGTRDELAEYLADFPRDTVNTATLKKLLERARDHADTPTNDMYYWKDIEYQNEAIFQQPDGPLQQKLQTLANKINATLDPATGQVKPRYKRQHKLYTERLRKEIAWRIAKGDEMGAASPRVVAQSLRAQILRLEQHLTRELDAQDVISAETYGFSGGSRFRPNEFLDKVFETQAPLTENTTFYRNVSQAGAKRIRDAGPEYADNGYMSVADSRELTAPYQANGVVIRVEVPAGARVLDMDKILEHPDAMPMLRESRLSGDFVTGEKVLPWGQRYAVRMDGDEIVLTLMQERTPAAQQLIDLRQAEKYFITRSKGSSGAKSHPEFMKELDDANDSTFRIPKLEEAIVKHIPDYYRVEMEKLTDDVFALGPEYTVQLAPKDAYLARPGDSLPEAMYKQHNLVAKVLYDHNIFGAPARFMDFILRPVGSSQMLADAEQAIMNEYIGAGAKPSEVRAFLGELRKEAVEKHSVSEKLGYRIYGSVKAVLPSDVNRIAREAFGETSRVHQVIGADGHHRVIDRAGSRILRDMRNRNGQRRKSGRLLSLVNDQFWRRSEDAFYTYKSGGVRKDGTALHGVVTGTLGGSRLIGNTLYHIFRFLLDPRWHLMNRFEHIILGSVRDGMGGKANEISPAFRRTSGMNEQFQTDPGAAVAAAGGGSKPSYLVDAAETGMFHGNRAVIGRIAKSFDQERPDTVFRVLEDMDQMNPSLVKLRRDFGDVDNRTLAEMLDEQWFNFDRKGVGKTVRDEYTELFINEPQTAQAMAEQSLIVQRITEANQQLYDDLIGTFLGNPNRNTLERVMNSYWLFWPISYQIKASKWLVRALTVQAFGRDTNALGLYQYGQLKEYFIDQLAHNETFAKEWEGQEHLWETAAMFFPITPEDIGASLSRPVRTFGSMVAPAWFEPTFGSKDPIAGLAYTFEVGPLYTARMLRSLSATIFPEGADLAIIEPEIPDIDVQEFASYMPPR